MLDLAIIIVSFNVRGLLRTTLTSLRTSLAASQLKSQVVVVDNQSQDESAAMVRAEFPRVTLLEPGANLGFAGGNNYALRRLGFGQPGSEYPTAVWLLNPDTEVVGQAPRQLFDHLRANPKVGMVGPALQYGDGRFQASAFGFPGLAQVALDLFPLHPRLLETGLNGRYPRSRYQAQSPFPVDMLLGAALMARGSAIAQVGLLDEGYFMYVEELDWCRRFKQAGWEAHVVPAATVIHHEGQSTRQFREEMGVALWRSRLRYYEKFEGKRYTTLVRALLRLGMRWQQRQVAAALSGGTLTPNEAAARLRAARRIAAL